MRSIAAVAILAAPAAAIAHDGIDDPRRWWLAWNPDPAILLTLGLLCGAYLTGLMRLWRRAGRGRGIARWQAASFIAALAALLIALISPIDRLSDELASVHMTQHMILMMVAAPLLVLASPGAAVLWALPGGAAPRRLSHPRRTAARLWRRLRPSYILWQPILMWSLYALALWVWHLPRLYEAALRSPYVHDLQHLAFFGASCLFWRVLLDPLASGRLRLSPWLGVLYLFTTSLHAGALGVFMALSPRVWYQPYVLRAGPWGIDPLADQQIAGLVMWMPACFIYALAAAALFGLWLHRAGERRGIAAMR